MTSFPQELIHPDTEEYVPLTVYISSAESDTSDDDSDSSDEEPSRKGKERKLKFVPHRPDFLYFPEGRDACPDVFEDLKPSPESERLLNVLDTDAQLRQGLHCTAPEDKGTPHGFPSPRRWKIVIMTDKPVYRPGETILCRVLLLDAFTQGLVSAAELQAVTPRLSVNVELHAPDDKVASRGSCSFGAGMFPFTGPRGAP